ncbi:MAG: caspase family protein [Planctomycetota bacterium]|nr:caspase family protein [Planctomycetota bacterium]
MGVRRSAILIEHGQSKYGILPGTWPDVEAYALFLQTPFGGAWRGDEIAILRSPRRALVNDLFAQMKKQCDLALVVFCGHGFFAHGRMYIRLNDGEYLAVDDVSPGTPRQMLVIDACRKYVEDGYVRVGLSEFVPSNVLHHPYMVSCRQLYDAAVMGADEGRSVMYACAANQSAAENAHGGYFSRSLISTTQRFAETHRSGFIATRVISLPEAFLGAYTETRAKRYPQEPVLQNGRRVYSFPFAVA